MNTKLAKFKPNIKKKNKKKKLVNSIQPFSALLRRNNNLLTKLLNQQKAQNNVQSTSLVPFTKSPNYFAESPNSFKNAYNIYTDDKLQVLQYIYALMHTDEIYNKGWAIKIPSRLPQPTTTFCFKDVEVLQPNSAGNLGIVWTPNYLGTSDKIRSMFTGHQYQYGAFANLYINIHNTVGSQASNYFEAKLFRNLNQRFSKYRLVSAMIKIKYIGAVINQAGTLSGCVSYSDFSREVYADDEPITNAKVRAGLFNQAFDRFGNFDIIKSGLWSRTISLTSDPEGLTAIYIPVDDLSEVFVDDGEMIAAHLEPGHDGTGLNWGVINPTNATPTYAFCVQGAPQNSCIQVEMYYNYEIVIEDDQVPYFRTGYNALIESQHSNVVREALSHATLQHGIIHPDSSYTDSFTNYASRAMNFIKRGISIYNVLKPVAEAIFQ